MKYSIAMCLVLGLTACGNAGADKPPAGKNEPVDTSALKPVVITDTVVFDTDDPAIWINPADHSGSLILGTDKEEGGGLYAFDLNGRIVNKIEGLKRPNNVDIAYGLSVKGQPVDIAVFTERKANKLRVVSLPDLKFIDNGGIPVFEGEKEKGYNEGMGIALYTAPGRKIYAIVGRKSGPAEGYLWQYELKDNGKGNIIGEVVRKFGKYSGKKEIEAIAADNELGYIYYADEQAGIRKYYADPSKGDEELAFFGTSGFAGDHEGISIYKSTDSTGYILVSNQQDNSFVVFRREGDAGNPHHHEPIAKVPVSTIESDGSDITALSLNSQFPKGLFVAMSNGKVFHYYDWRQIEERILNSKR